LLNHEQIEAIAAVLRQSPSLTEVEVRNGTGVSLRLRRPSRKVSSKSPPPSSTPIASTATVSSAQATTDRGQKNETIPLTATVVGIFRALPGDSAFSAGKAVKQGQIVGHIEAMRLLNECLAPESGTITGILVDEGQPVEYGQLLFEITLTA
jgi:acetyl-CoA carboxylase biotin carboxyl carrier protein